MTETTLPYLRRGTGAPLVVFPGLVGRSGVPAGFARRMQHSEIAGLATDREVWTINRRFGLEPGISFEELAAEHAEAIQQLFAGPVDVLGVSTGGSVALQLAADYPHLVSRLVLVSSAFRLSDHGRLTQQRIAANLRGDRSRLAASQFLSNTGASAAGRFFLSLAGLVAPRLVVGHRDADLLVTLDAEDGFDLSARAASIQAPTLIAGGGRDRFYTAEMFEATHALLPNSSLTLYPRAGHMSMLGNRALAREVLTFLSADSSTEQK